jgi:hypothetical protein
MNQLPNSVCDTMRVVSESLIKAWGMNRGMWPSWACVCDIKLGVELGWADIDWKLLERRRPGGIWLDHSTDIPRPKNPITSHHSICITAQRSIEQLRQPHYSNHLLQLIHITPPPRNSAAFSTRKTRECRTLLRITIGGKSRPFISLRKKKKAYIDHCLTFFPPHN